MTQPVPNMQAKLVDKFGYLLPPWNSFFQQLVQPAPAVANILITNTPYTANANGTLIIKGAATTTLTRGTVSIPLNGQVIIPISVGDTVSWTGAVSVQFLGA